MRIPWLLALALLPIGCSSRGVSVSAEGVELVVVEYGHLVFERAALEGVIGPIETRSAVYLSVDAYEALAQGAEVIERGTLWSRPCGFVPGRLAAPPPERVFVGERPPWPHPLRAELFAVWQRGTRTEAEIGCFRAEELDCRLPISLGEGEHAVLPLAVEPYEVLALVVRADP